MNPEWIEVDSSAIESVAYEDGELFVQWRGGGASVYAPVPEDKFEEMRLAESIGGYVNREIKPYYEHRKL